MGRMFEVALQSAMNKAMALLAIMLLKQIAAGLIIIGANIADLIKKLGWWRREQGTC